MKISNHNISFKAVIPKYKTTVQNKQTGKFEPALFCEVDCKNKNDYKIFSKLGDSWEYASCLETSAEWKYGNQKAKFDDPRGHYIIKKENGEILAICRTFEQYGKTRIDFLESKPESQYRFAGQMILAGIAKEAIKKGSKTIVIESPVAGSDRFYEGICGFKEEDRGFVLKEEDLINFSKRTPRQ